MTARRVAGGRGTARSAPGLRAELAGIPEDVYSPLADRVAAHPGPLVPLHVGDTWLEPPEVARAEALRSELHPGLHRYADTRGLPELVDALVDKLRERNGIPCERDEVLVTAGATGALAAAVGSFAGPGDEVLILAPFWPLIRGIVTCLGAVPVEVPFYDRLDSASGAVEAVREHLGPRTKALYVSSQSNPTRRVLPESWLAALAEFCRDHGLWLLPDEVYEDLVYRGEAFSPARVAPERTFSVFSFSKSYGMAGWRVGYLAGPREAVAAARKLATHLFYQAPTPGQAAALGALRGGGGFVARARSLYAEIGAEVAELLGLPPPEGSTFLFLDLARWPGSGGLWRFLERCLDEGVLLAPGAACGEAYAGFARLCYTAAPPDQVRGAVERVARILRG